ncbi:MAG: response regulator [candidate division Zixibacteria bacterium]|nr:response regulator [candidate division Zixibacteria bacterium]
MAADTAKIILVVDDEEDIRNYLSLALTDAGFTVIMAANGDEAMDQMKKRRPDLISLDLVMPKKSGIKFYRELTRKKEWADIPILIVTGHARDDLGRADLKELTMSGPGIYLEKPVKPHNYIAAIKSLLNMVTTPDEKEMAEDVAIQNELKNLIDNADPTTLRALKDLIKKRME